MKIPEKVKTKLSLWPALFPIGLCSFCLFYIINECSKKKEVKQQEPVYTQRDWVGVRIILDHDTLTVVNYDGSENYILSNGLSVDRKIVEESE